MSDKCRQERKQKTNMVEDFRGMKIDRRLETVHLLTFWKVILE